MTPFITTYTGKKVNPLDLDTKDISVLDIAHHLSLINRFVGASHNPISVAQHSVYVYRLVAGTDWEAEALFHDAPEAYLGDLSKWVKQMDIMEGYRTAEVNAWGVICDALILRHRGSPEHCKTIREADNLMVRYEHMQEGTPPHHLFEIPSHPRPTKEEIDRIETLCGKWEPWPWKLAKDLFLSAARDLGF